MARIGIYGGSFNPIHFGHIGLVRWVAEHTSIEEVWLMVSPNNPLKSPSLLADEQVRLKAAQQAIESLGAVRVSDFEFHLPRPSYTANTLRELERAYPEHTFCLIIGEDNWDIFNQWREWEYILRHYSIYIYPRHQGSPNDGANTQPKGTPIDEMENRWTTEGALDNQSHLPEVHYLKDAPYFDISSTAIREQKRGAADG